LPETSENWIIKKKVIFSIT